ncbi:MAG: DedA family protein [Minisyncoccia bacterium]
MELPFLGMTLPEMIASVGYLGVFLIVFVESGIPIGIVLPLPGDTLLFSAGLLAAGGAFSLVPLITTIVIAAIVGDSAGYWFGATYGPKIFAKGDGLFLNRRNLERTTTFYQKYGKGALIVARFLPLFRTLVPIFAGVGSMRYRDFLFFNVAGALLWGISITLLGYYLGTLIPNVDHYLLPILMLVIIVSGISMWREYIHAKRERAKDG